MKHSIRTVAIAVALGMMSVAMNLNAQEQGVGVYNGIIRVIDAQTRSIAVEGEGISQTFSVPEQAEIVVKDTSSGSFNDLKVGEGVSVQYSIENGKYIVRRINDLGLK